MKRYLVQHFYLDKLGNDILQSEVVFGSEREARIYASALLRRHNGYHAFYVVEMVVKSMYRFPENKEVK